MTSDQPAPRPYDPAGQAVGAQSTGRHGDYSRLMIKGPHLRVKAATFFGSSNHETFIAAGTLADDTIVAVGNAAGPGFPTHPAIATLGKGRHSGAQPKLGKKGEWVPSPDDAGMIVQYARDLKSMLRIVRFDWGVATIDAALVSADGKALIVAGQCQRDFATFAQTVTGTKRIPLEIPPTGATKKSSAAAPAGDVFLVRFNAATLKPEWLWVLEKAGTPPDRLFADPAGNILFDVAGLRAVTANGKELKLIHPRRGDGKARWLGVDPVDGAAYFGGDRNTQCGVTRRWPYRQPFLDKFKGEEKIWTLWEPVPTEVGPDTGKMESDSSPRTLGWAANGDLIIGGWSDGGNSVFIRQAKNWREPAGSGGMGLKTYGMRNANTLAHLMVIDAKTLDTKLHNWWASFIPSWYADPKLRGAPNAAMIEQMLVLDDFSVAIAGAAATGYLQTPGAFWLDESPACAALASVPALPNAARHGSFPCHDLRRPV